MYGLKQKSFIDGLSNGISLIPETPSYINNIKKPGIISEKLHKQLHNNEQNSYKQLKSKLQKIKSKIIY